MKNKLLYLATALIGVATTTNAQTAHTTELRDISSGPTRAHFTNPALKDRIKGKDAKMHDAILKQAIGTGRLNAAAKTTSTITDERLIGDSYYTYADLTGSGTAAWTMVDSGDYKYFGERRSWFNFNNMNYTNYYSLYSNQPIGLGQVFGGHDRDGKSEVLSDSAHRFGIITSTTPEQYMTTYQVFDTADNIVDYTEIYPTFSFGQRMLLSFNSNNRPTFVKYLQYNGTGWDTTEKRYVNYNADTVSTDSTAVYSTSWDPEHKLAYTYDASGKTVTVSQFDYDGSTWYESYRYGLSYYPSGNFKQMITSAAPAAGNPLDTVGIDTVGWTAGVPYMTYLESRSVSGGVVDQKYFMTKHVNTTTGLPDTSRLVQYDFTTPAYDTLDQQTTYVYDTYNNPTLATTWGKTNRSLPAYDTLDHVQHFYYELFTRDNTGVTNIAKGGFKLYPNPATSDLFITQGSSAATLATVKMFDITGRAVINTEATSGNMRISMSNLPQGTYMVLLQDTDGNTLQREKVIKL